MVYKYISSSLRRKHFIVDVMIINGNGQQIQVCNLLILHTQNVTWLNWHVERHLSKKLKSQPNIFWQVGNSVNV